MTLIAFRGATAFECQVGRLWLTFLRPRFWVRGNLQRVVRIGWEKPA